MGDVPRSTNKPTEDGEVIDFDKDAIRQSRPEMEALLRSAGGIPSGKTSMRCPFHDDKSPSAQLKQSPTGIWRFTCFVCGLSLDYYDLKARVSGRDVGEVLKESNPQIQQPRQTEAPKLAAVSFRTIEELIDSYKSRNPQSVIQEVNRYTDPQTGTADFCTLRIVPQGESKKTFRQVSRKADGWQWSGLEGNLPLFNRTRIIQSERILIVEGEKCVREVTKLGASNLATTTSPGGAVAASKADWTPLAGKTCYVWRDNDDPGKQYETDVIAALMKLDPPCRVYRIRVEELELDPKGDVVNYLDDASMTNSDKVAALELVLFDAEPMNVTSALEKKFSKIMSGEFRAIPFPQKPLTSDNSKAILPGCLTTICGEPGSGKSFLILEDFWRWSLQKGESVKLLMLEDDNAFHQNRALAQMSGHADLLDPDFVLDNKEFSNSIFDQYREHLEYFSRHMETANAQMTLTEIAGWVINHAENGIRIIGVDPITAAKASDKPWIDDQRFLFEVKPVLERTGASLILTTHPRIGQAGKPSLSGIAGGASYPRFSQCVLWLRNLDKEQEIRAWNGYHIATAKHKQVLEIRKARNGKGQGKHIAINLNTENLCLDEFGVIQDD
jgi:hypothetical protein